jgi:hypothetical protein
MNMEKRWKSIMTLGGLLLVLMMTAATVSAEDPIARDGSVPDEATPIEDTTTDGDAEPMLIAPLENETTEDTILISPGPEGTSKAASTLDLPLLGIIGAVVIIALALVAIAIRRK